jgi:nucleotide-binding universal stress UspA family protein
VIVLKNVLIATDFGEPSQAAMAYACDVAKAFSARLHLVHVVDDLAARGTPLPVLAQDLSRLQAEREDDARKKLNAMLDADLRANGATTVVLTSDRPASAILTYARDTEIDLIVAGTHGRSGFADLFMGSVAQQIVRTAQCPVLTLRQAGRERESQGVTAVVWQAS